MADWMAATGRPEEAEKAYCQVLSFFEKYVADYPSMLKYRRNVASTRSKQIRLLKAAGRSQDVENAYRQAIDFYAKLAGQSPNEPDFWQELAQAHYQLGEWEKAVTAFSKVIELKPDSASSRNSLAWLLATSPEPKARNSVRAVDLAKKAVELAPHEGTYWNSLGVAQYRAGNLEAARAALEKSMELRNGGDGLDWFFLAMTHWELGEKVEASKRYGQAVTWLEKNQPNNGELRRFRAEAQELMGVTAKPREKSKN